MTATLNMGDTSTLVSLLRSKLDGEPRYGVEVGVHRGATSAMLLREFPTLHLVMVDPWEAYLPDHPYWKSGDGCSKLTAEQQEAYMAAATVAVQPFRTRAEIIRKPWSDVAANSICSDERFDFIFIDGQHQEDAVTADIDAAWPHIRPGGILCGHDWGHPRNAKGYFGVEAAVKKFVEARGEEWGTEGECWWIRKPAETAG